MKLADADIPRIISKMNAPSNVLVQTIRLVAKSSAGCDLKWKTPDRSCKMSCRITAQMSIEQYIVNRSLRISFNLIEPESDSIGWISAKCETRHSYGAWGEGHCAPFFMATAPKL